MKTLIIGDTSPNLATWTVDHYGPSMLINRQNYLSNQHEPGIWYTALGDLDFDQIKSLALDSQQVVFVQDLPWRDQKAYLATVALCNHLGHFREIQGFEPRNSSLYLSQSVDRISPEPILWSFGCSTTAGVGLDRPDHQCYGKLVADRLGMIWQNVAQSGSSVRWSLAHMVQADIRSGDFVVWGTTSAERIRRARSQTVVEDRQLTGCSHLEVMYHDDYQIYFDHVDYINTGLRYLRSRGIKFVFITLIDDHASRRQDLEIEFSTNPEWVPVLGWNTVDRGNDNMHIGPLGHENLARHIYNHVQLLGYV